MNTRSGLQGDSRDERERVKLRVTSESLADYKLLYRWNCMDLRYTNDVTEVDACFRCERSSCLLPLRRFVSSLY